MATQFDMQEREWENHPEGVFVAQLANFVDEGEKEGRYGPYRSAYYLLQTGEVDSTGQVFPEMRYYVNTNASEKSKTTLFRNAVAGRTLTRDERTGTWNPDSILGYNVQIQVAHIQREDKVYAQVVAVMAMPKGGPAPAAQQRTQPPPQSQQGAQGAQQDDSDLPF